MRLLGRLSLNSGDQDGRYNLESSTRRRKFVTCFVSVAIDRPELGSDGIWVFVVLVPKGRPVAFSPH